MKASDTLCFTYPFEEKNGNIEIEMSFTFSHFTKSQNSAILCAELKLNMRELKGSNLHVVSLLSIAAFDSNFFSHSRLRFALNFRFVCHGMLMDGDGAH